MNEPIRLTLEVVVTPETVAQISELMTPRQTAEQKRIEASRKAAYAGAEAPEDASMLLDMKQVAKHLGISERSVWGLHASGSMPEAMRLGRAVRWRRAEIEAWINTGCPPASKWKRPR